MHNRGEDKKRSPHRLHCKVSVFYPYGKISVTYRSVVVGFLRISASLCRHYFLFKSSNPYIMFFINIFSHDTLRLFFFYYLSSIKQK